MYNGVFAVAAPALAHAKETARIAFAPSFALFGVPSNFNIMLSIFLCFLTSLPFNLRAIFLFTLLTALRTPLPSYLLPPSLNSKASCTPVEAPEGTEAVPSMPLVKVTVA